jgi:hypothetical protein
MASASDPSDDLADTVQAPTESFILVTHRAGVTTIETASDPSDDEDTVRPPADGLTLVIDQPDPEALDWAKAAAMESRKSGIDEIVLLPAPRFHLPGLMHLRSFMAERIKANPQPFTELAELHAGLLAEDLAAATVDMPSGKVHSVDRNRWRARDAEGVLRTARLGEADIYVVTDPIAAGLVEAPLEHPPWWPGELEILKSWCLRGDVEAEARARLAEGGLVWLSMKKVYAAICGMWHEAGKKYGTPATIEQYFQKARGPRRSR